jgi:hypothetical protein
VWEEREPTTWKEPTIDETRSPYKSGSPDKASAEARPPNKPSAEAASADARAAEATTAEATATEATTTKSRLGRSRDQHGAKQGPCRQSGEFLVDHALPPLGRQPL